MGRREILRLLKTEYSRGTENNNLGRQGILVLGQRVDRDALDTVHPAHPRDRVDSWDIELDHIPECQGALQALFALKGV